MANYSAFIDKLRVLVLENYSNEQFGVSELVRQSGVSRSQLHRKLKSATGQSVSQFIREIRLEEALKFLQEEDVTASEVAYRVGFSSPTYFNTCFHEYFGYPPGEARLQLELSKSNNYLRPQGAPKSENQRNKRLLVWLSIVILFIGTLSVYQYLTWKSEQRVSSVEKEKTIAVLPLKNWSGDVELEYISDGITDAIISKLANIEGIDRVIPFTTMILYKDTNKDLGEIANELKVAYVLEGNFKLSGDAVQSNLKLIEANTLDQVWDSEYKGTWKTNEIFEMQASVAENVARSMRVNIANNELNALQYQPTTSEEAYRIYLKAEYQLDKLSEFGLNNSIGLYEQAIAIDSNFVEAYIGLGTVYLISGAVWGLMPQKEAWEKSKGILETALTVDSLASGRNILYIKSQLHGGYFYYELDIGKSEERFNAILNEPGGVEAGQMSFDYNRKTGRFDFAMKNIEDDIANNPTDGLDYMQQAFLFFMQGDKEQAIRQLDFYDPLYQDNYFYLLETSKWYYYMGEIAKSKKHLDQLLDQHQDRPPIVYWLIAIHSEIEKDNTQLNASLNTLERQFVNNKSGSPAWFLALYYLHVDDLDMAFEWLNRSHARKEVEMTWLKEEPMFQSLKEDPRYIELFEKMGFQYIKAELKK